MLQKFSEKSLCSFFIWTPKYPFTYSFAYPFILLLAPPTSCPSPFQFHSPSFHTTVMDECIVVLFRELGVSIDIAKGSARYFLQSDSVSVKGAPLPDQQAT